MADDSLEGMPEFGPEEEKVPLVVPDLSKPVCQATTKAGKPCPVHPMKGEKYCIGHTRAIAPEIRDKWRKLSLKVPKRHRKMPFYTREELLGILSSRLDFVLENYGTVAKPEVEYMICEIVKSMASAYRIDIEESNKEGAGWRMKGAV